jgi:hypothetical protein
MNTVANMVLAPRPPREDVVNDTVDVARARVAHVLDLVALPEPLAWSAAQPALVLGSRSLVRPGQLLWALPDALQSTLCSAERGAWAELTRMRDAAAVRPRGAKGAPVRRASVFA